MDELIRPDYDAACVTRVVPALRARERPDWIPAPARDARAVVLLVLDGLGWDAIGARTPTLRAMEGGPISTVLPSSTASALTSLTTGRPPTEHGITGIHMMVGGTMMHSLRWTTPGQGDAPPPDAVQTFEPFGGTEVAVLTRAEFSGSGFSEAHLRGARFHGWRTTTTLVHGAAKLIARGEGFVWAYYDGVDTVAHSFGPEDGFYDAEVSFADRLVGELLDLLPDDVALVVTADHGQVPLDRDRWMTLDDVEHLIREHAGDARCRFLYARDGATADLAAATREVVGERGMVLSRDELLDEGWLGPRTALAADRVGDVTLLARDTAFMDPNNKRELALRSGHGSATRAELFVPLLGARGRA